MNRLLASMIFSVGFGACVQAGAATVSQSFAEYTVTYDDATVLGSIDFFSSGSRFGFGWNLPASISVSGTSALVELPSFTVSANPGYTLTGSIGGYLDKLYFGELHTASTFAGIGGTLSLDSNTVVSFASPLTRTTLLSLPGLTTGYYSYAGSTDPGASFASFGVSDFALLIAATDYAAVSGLGQATLKVEFSAVPVPEPDQYALLLAGLCMMSLVARRRLSR